jgi:hypothetical protein
MWDMLNSYYSRWPYRWRKRIKPKIKKKNREDKNIEDTGNNTHNKPVEDFPKGNSKPLSPQKKNISNSKKPSYSKPLVWKFPEK